MADSAVHVHAGGGKASLHVKNLELEDYHDINNALSDGPSLEGRASYRVDWHGGHHKVKIHDPSQGFEGDFVEGRATIEWSATNEDGFRFVSDRASTTTTISALVGKERNGSFFS